MFDFNKIKMKPSYAKDFELVPTEEQLLELEQYCGHKLPENYRIILKNYNGGHPEARYFDVVDQQTGIPGEWELNKFYYLNDDKMPTNIWWIIEHYAGILGPHTLPFADDGFQQIYYLKWVNNIAQVWFLAYLDCEEPEHYFVRNSFDDLLGALYAAD